MTREAKIGMLTGLGVIVLIGVLLSSYLGDGGRAGVGPLAAAANRMAPLPAGEVYRQQQLQPVGVPAMTPGGHKVKLADGTEVLSPIDTMQAVPVAMAVELAPAGPVVGPMVAAVPTGPSPVVRDASVPPTFEMTDRLFDASLKDLKAAASPAAQSAPTNMTYTIAAGDNLAKIAKKFYNSSKNSDIARIVKANPTMLKDASTPLMVSKKLVIPAVMSVAATPSVDMSRVDGVVVYRPGDAAVAAPMNAPSRKVERPSSTIAPSPNPVSNAPARTANPAPAAKTYVVQSGDSLEKIARRIAPSKVNETMQKLISINGIKNAGTLQAGAKLKLPA